MKVAGVGVCRNRFHVSIHNPTAEKVFCNNCEDYVTFEKNRICPCCSEKTKKKKTFYLTKKILNSIVTGEYKAIIESFIESPTRESITIYNKQKYITYSVPLSCAALYHDTIEQKKLPSWARKVFSAKDYSKLRRTEIIPFVDGKIKGVGIG